MIKSIASIGSCKVEVLIEVKSTRKNIRLPVYAKKIIVILPRSQAQILVHHATLLDRDFLFKPIDSKLSLYAYLVDSSILIILAKNNSNIAITVLRNYYLGIIYDTNFNNYYLVS